jgi:ABC-type antimicrobial peptide transport system permease subunit
VIGVIASLVIARALKTLVFNVSPNDPAIYSVVVLIVMSVAFLACYIPARRATQADPMSALRAE